MDSSARSWFYYLSLDEHNVMLENGYAQSSLAQMISVGFGVGSRNTAGLKEFDYYPNKE
jgi:hypothetical protein